MSSTSSVCVLLSDHGPLGNHEAGVVRRGVLQRVELFGQRRIGQGNPGGVQMARVGRLINGPADGELVERVDPFGERLGLFIPDPPHLFLRLFVEIAHLQLVELAELVDGHVAEHFGNVVDVDADGDFILLVQAVEPALSDRPACRPGCPLWD